MGAASADVANVTDATNVAVMTLGLGILEVVIGRSDGGVRRLFFVSENKTAGARISPRPGVEN